MASLAKRCAKIEKCKMMYEKRRHRLMATDGSISEIADFLPANAADGSQGLDVWIDIISRPSCLLTLASESLLYIIQFVSPARALGICQH